MISFVCKAACDIISETLETTIEIDLYMCYLVAQLCHLSTSAEDTDVTYSGLAVIHFNITPYCY